MHKLILSLLLFSSVSVAQILAQKLEQAKQEALEKHLIEKEKAKRDLKISGAATMATAVVYIGIETGLCAYLNLFDKILVKYGSEASMLGATLVLAVDAGIGIYAIYKGGQGAKHLLVPDYPKPEETTTNEISSDV